MYGMGEEEFKKCLESLGYVSEKESDSNFEETKSECDELYERYKPPPRKIDPKKSKIIILNDNGGSELSLNSNIKKNGKKKRNRKRKKKKKSSATMDVTSENNKPGCHPDQHYFQKEVLAELVCDTSNLKDVYAQENRIFSINCYYYFLQQHINYSYYLDENIGMLSETKNTNNNENNFRGTLGSSLTLYHLKNNGMTAVPDENNQCLHTLEYSKNCELSALPSRAHSFVPESPKNLSHIRLYNYIIENMTLDGTFFCDTTHQFIQISKYFKKYDCYDELSNDAHSLHKWFENFNQVHLSNNAITRVTTSDRKYLYSTDQNNLAEYSKYCEFSALSGICHSLMLTGLYENFSHIQLLNIAIENVTADRKYVSEANQNESDQLIKITQNSKNWVLSSDVTPLISSGSVESLKHNELSSATIEDMTSERKYFYGTYSSTSWYDFQSAYLNEDMLSLVTKKTIKSTETTKSNGGNPLISSGSVDSLNYIELSSATIEDMTSERKYFYGSYSSASWYDFQSAYLNEDTSSLVTRKKDNKYCIIRKTETPKVQILEATESNSFDIICKDLINDWSVVNLVAGYLILRLILPWILTCVIYIFDKTIDVIVLIFLLLYLSVIFVTKY